MRVWKPVRVTVYVLLGAVVVVGVLLLIAQDQKTLHLDSVYGAADARFPAYVAALVGADATSGNTYQVLTNGDQIFPAMLDAINGAKKRISFETYIYDKGVVADRFTAALAAAARRGVRVNLVVDAIGADRMGSKTIDALRAAGCRIGKYHTAGWYSLEDVNYRTHRKILVVDGSIGFTGGVGVADHWLGHAQDRDHWRDTQVRMEGPIVRLLEAAFDENYIETSQEATPVIDVPGAPEPPRPTDSSFVLRSSPTGGANDLKRLYLLAVASARHTLDICSPYFVTDESTGWALDRAVRRGVRVRILVEGDMTDAMPVKYASRYAYEDLMRRGIEIYEYRPTMMHTKAMVVDGVWSMVGSANFDNRSLELNDELNVAISEPVVAARLLDDFNADLKSAHRLEPQTWRHRSPLEKTREWFWSFFDEVF
ncbi:MAG TPA: phospholipase D-like domain-containing protein [Vicinamibacterales bacterium]|nr:phospholipase D-like domain-containing protein [Vicinamibacterales bacterium]